MTLRRLACLLVALCFVPALHAQGDKTFSIPLEDLKTWSQHVVTRLDSMKIEGNSKVHPLQSDCEIHFGGHSANFHGTPTGLVLEPMNACVEPFIGETTYSKKAWTDFAAKIKGKTVKVEGVPRIWPEHLDGEESPSNPHHAVELHPLTQVTLAGKKFDFVPFVSAPDGYAGGVGETTAQKIVEDTEVGVTLRGDIVDIDFDGGRIGNFTVLDVRILRDTIKDDGDGSSRMDGEVIFGRQHPDPVHLVSIKGTDLNKKIQNMTNGQRAKVRLEMLVLFSLSPEALVEAAAKSHGGRVVVGKPLQLILYGEPES
jgi:hypothetical protein